MRIGAAPYLHTLISMVPTAANAGYYAGIVAEKALLRRLVAAGTGWCSTATPAPRAPRWPRSSTGRQSEIYDVTEDRGAEDYAPLGDLLQPTMDEIDAISSHGGLAAGVPTGFVELDEVSTGLHGGP